MLKRTNSVLEALVLHRTADLEESRRLLRATLEHMDQGLVLLDQNQTVRLCNPRALELLRLPEDVLHESAAFRDVRAFQNERGDFSMIAPSTSSIIKGSDARLFPLIYDWPRPDGKTLEVRRVQLPDGSSVNTFTDATERRASEAAVRQSESRYRLLAERVEELAQIDELTGVLNRRYIMQELSDEMSRAQRTAEACSIAMIDLDFFKRVNDRFGHPAGDEVLRSFAIAASANIRTIDRLGRYGGEEFLLILPRASKEPATLAVNRLREIVANLDWTAISDELVVTISGGVAQVRLDEAPDEVLARADTALYGAKDAGRNRVISA
ncbi:GGDEF domain-containing protein [Bradyrhizobium sp.]|uniref:GGDEF domain-containing protein n=1 Tax=Bradyrhizobium sp. TaxID=376 RepID=UPI003C262FC9